MFPLHLRSYYSLMRGTMSPADICKRAKSFGYTGVAITDRNNLYGLWSFLSSCKREGLNPIIGAEISDKQTGKIVTCLVKNVEGYKNLCNLITLHHGRKNFSLKTLVSHAAGLFVLSSDLDLLQFFSCQGLNPMAEIGPWPDENAAKLRRWAKSQGIRAVATHNCGMAEEEDFELYVLLRSIGKNTSYSEAYAQQDAKKNYFSAPGVYEKRFHMWPEVVAESYLIGEMCSFAGPDFGLVMPPWKEKSPQETLRKWAYEGAWKRYGKKLSEAVKKRLDYELTVIEQMGFSSYFLVVRNIVHPVQEDGIRRARRICGRGSGAASLVAYCLEITNVCPIRYNLYFERFLNPGRTDPPDIDIDFAWDERDAVLNEVLEDNKGHAAMVCNHVFFKPRMAIRETAKSHGMPGYEISRITKKLSSLYRGNDELLGQVRKTAPLQGVNLDPPWPMIIELADKLVGIPRYLSVHPGGVVITPEKIWDYVPVEYGPKGVPVIQWEKDGAEEAGLVKIDLLGNRSLGVIRDCIASVRKNGAVFQEEGWDPEADTLTKKRVAQGNTMGCFYIESPAMRLLQRKARSGSYEQLVLQSSIIRPAANEFVREYVRRLHGGSWEPLHEKLDDVLNETYGIMVYQEDVSRVAVHLAGFSHARADGLRKVMSKKDRALALPDYKVEFFQGCRKENVDINTTEKVWEMMMSFDGYSFCKPHSASYAKVSFQAAYLKTYFPAEFMAAVISNQGGFYSTFAYVSEAKRLGVSILPPDVNLSEKRWKGRGRKIRVGLQSVLGLSEGAIARICSARGQKKYRDATDFFMRTDVAEDEARALIYAGALDSLQKKVNRTLLFWEFNRYKRLRLSKKSMTLFELSLPELPQLPKPSRKKMLRKEYEILGFLCSAHPMALFCDKIRKRVVSREVSRYSGKVINFAGWLLTGKMVSTKTGEVMEFLTFEDEYGVVETTFFPQTYKRYANILQTGRPYMLKGLVEEDFGVVTLTVINVGLLTKT